MNLIPIPVEGQVHAQGGNGVFSRQVVDSQGRKSTAFYTLPRPPYSGAWFMRGGVATDVSSQKKTINLTVDRGYVNALEPIVKSQDVTGPISGDWPKIPIPTISAPAVFDTEGRAWVGILLTIDFKTGRMKNNTQAKITPDDLTIAIKDKPYISSGDGTTHFHPIGCILKDESPIQIAFFDYQWSCVLQHGIWRHYFIPA